MKNIIAMDVGSTLALASNCTGHAGDGEVFSKTFEGTREVRIAAAMCWLETVFRSVKAGGRQVDVLIYERPFARGIHATRALWGLAGVIEALATAAGWAVLDVPPATIKHWCCGTGNAPKNAMIGAAQIMGYDGDDEHEADAFCLLRYAEENVVGREEGTD